MEHRFEMANYNKIKRSVIFARKHFLSLAIFLYFGGSFVVGSMDTSFCHKLWDNLGNELADWRERCLDGDDEINSTRCQAEKEYFEERRRRHRQMCFYEGPYPEPYLLVLSETKIAVVDLTSNYSNIVINQHQKIENLIIDPVKRHMYYKSERKVYRANFDGSDKKVIYQDKKNTIQKFAFDWIGQHMFWLNSKGAKWVRVGIASFSGKRFYRSYKEKITDLAIDPNVRYVFCKNGGSVVTRINFNGENHTNFHIKDGQSMFNLDYVNKELYYYQTNNTSVNIQFLDYDGVLLQNISLPEGNVSALSVFGDFILLQKVGTGVIKEIDLSTRAAYRYISLPKPLSSLNDIVIVDQSQYPTGELKRRKPGKGPPWFVQAKPGPQFIFWSTSNDYNFELRCRADGEPPLKYQWLKDGKVLKYRRLDPKFNATKWYLRIKTVVPSDSGHYICVVSNRLGNISSQSIKLNVEGAVRPVLSPQYPINKTARIGDNVTFQCIELFSPVLYRWLHWKKLPPSYPDLGFDDNSPSMNSSYYTLINQKYYKRFDVHKKDGKYGGRVLLNNVTKEDEGMYTCLISNHLGKASRSAFLRVISSDDEPPEFVPQAQSYMTEVNKTVYLKCDFTAWYANWGMIWYKHDTIIQPEMDTKFQIVTGKSSFLIIKDVQKEDAGIFECVASNAFGSVSKKMNLTVTG